VNEKPTKLCENRGRERLSGKVILPRYSPFFPWNHSIDKRKEKREKSELECEERRERRELHEHFS